MITSMTGFGLVEKSNSIFSIEINFRSVNSRFFDSNIRLPHSISSLEQEIYKLLKDQCRRGTVNVNCKLKMNDDKLNLSKIDMKKLNQFYDLLSPINKKFSDTNLKLNLTYDNILNKVVTDESDFELHKLVTNLMIHGPCGKEYSYNKCYND